jgi:hypothetical protein
VYWHPSLPVFVVDEKDDDVLAYAERTSPVGCISHRIREKSFLNFLPILFIKITGVK